MKLLLLAAIAIQLCESQVLKDNSECGTTKSCWFMPASCETDINSCDAVVKWSGGEVLDIEMEGNFTDMPEFFPYPGYYLSIGWSKDELMGEDTIIECVRSSRYNRIKAYVSFNDGLDNHRMYQATEEVITMQSNKYVDSRLYCQVQWNSTQLGGLFPTEKPFLFDISSGEYKLMIAMGTSDPLNDKMIIHPTGDLKYPWTSTEFVSMATSQGNVQSVTKMKQSTISRETRYLFAAIHGAMMLFGWWGFGGVAILFSRYFKSMWPTTKWFGETVWYQLHRDLFLISMALQLIGFALVFIQAGRMFLCDTTVECIGKDYILLMHTILGLICTILCLIEPFMAWIRPDGDSSYRVFFNWGHWVMGQMSWVLAAITMFLGIPLGKTGLRRNYGYKADWIMGAYVAAYCLTSVALEIICSKERRKNTVGAPSEMKMAVINGPKQIGSGRSPPFPLLRSGIMVVFTIVSFAVCTAITYMLFAMLH